jgi:hypothetical protein
MTTIAWKGDLLAADTQLTWDDHIRGRSPPKIALLPTGIILAGAGDNLSTIIAERFFSNPKWEETEPKERPKLKKYEAIIVIDGKVYQMAGRLIPQLLADPFYAIGSGWKFAIAAMARGDTAPEAVLFASTLDINTNSDLQVVNIHHDQQNPKETKSRARRNKKQA